MKAENKNKHDRMSQDINHTSRTMKPGGYSQDKQDSQGKSPASKSSGKTTSQGRGWHGDSEGHAKAGSQSHKSTGSKKS